jgi:DNA-directed RNA polymerase subunit M/transcription elongation factor TFIIS
MSDYIPRNPKKRNKDFIIKRHYKLIVISNGEDQKILQATKCPECGGKVAYYTNGEKKYHTCTICNAEVYL